MRVVCATRDARLGTRDVQSRIVLRTLALAGIGLVVGVAASWVLVRSVSGLLYGVASGDPPTFAAAALILTAIAALAAVWIVHHRWRR